MDARDLGLVAGSGRVKLIRLQDLPAARLEMGAQQQLHTAAAH